MELDQNLVTRILNGKPVTFTAETAIGDFVFHLPTAWDEVKIERGISLRCGDRPPESYSKDAIMFFRALATLTVVVDKSPDGWGGADECSDMDFIGELYGRYLRFRSKHKGPPPEFGKGTGEDFGADGKPPVGGGAFSGIAHGPEV